ncbi:DUF6331 family protein [Micromonospora chokoriensis]
MAATFEGVRSGGGASIGYPSLVAAGSGEGAAVADVSVEIPSPLSTCITFCETECVVGCCGIDAVSTDPALIEAWCVVPSGGA